MLQMTMLLNRLTDILSFRLGKFHLGDKWMTVLCNALARPRQGVDEARLDKEDGVRYQSKH
jgi:hypothetical protein